MPVETNNNQDVGFMRYHHVHCTGCGERFPGDRLAFDIGALINEAIIRAAQREIAANSKWEPLTQVDLCLYYTWTDLQRLYNMKSDDKSHFKFTVDRLRAYLVKIAGVASFEVLYTDVYSSSEETVTLMKLTNTIKHPLLQMNDRFQRRQSMDKRDLIPPLKEIIYLCSSRMSDDPQEVIAEFDLTPVLGVDDRNQPIPEKLEVEFLDLDINQHGKSMVVGNRVCPKCGKAFYRDAGKYEEIIIGMAGTARVGKTAYLAALIKSIKDSNNNNFIKMITPTDDPEWKFFKRHILDPYEMNADIDKTAFNTNDKETIPLFTVCMAIGGKKYAFTFIDMPGEAFTAEGGDYGKAAESTVLNDKRVLKYANAIWCCFAPGQVDKSSDASAVEAESNRVKTDLGEVMDGLAKMLDYIGAQKIPAAVMITKSDTISGNRGLFKPDCNVLDEYTMDFDKLDYGKTVQHCELVCEYLKDVKCQEMQGFLENTFSGYELFSVAAYGGQIDAPNFTPRPSMIALPFLWTIASLGKIEAMEITLQKVFSIFGPKFKEIKTVVPIERLMRES